MKRRNLRYITSIIAVVICAVLTGCGGGGGGGSRADDPGSIDPSGGDWTVLVYMNADNDLEHYGILNLNQMEMVGSTSRVKIVVQMDRAPGDDSTNGNWTGCRRYLVIRDGDRNTINSSLVQDMGEVDMGQPETLRDFIAWGQQAYPANHYCLVVWNHGSGWRSAQTAGMTTRNVSFDDTSGTSIRTADLAYALSSASQQIDLVAFDASLMQMLEVAYELRNSARYLVGSEESPPGEGYPYNEWLAPLSSAPTTTAPNLGRLIAQKFVASYTYRADVTQSVLDLSMLPGVAAAVDQLGSSLRPLAGSKASALSTARQLSQHYRFDYYLDLLDYAERVNTAAANASVSAACAQVQSALSEAVVYEAHAGATVANSHGLSIYIPAPSQYLDRYATLNFCVDYPNWAVWLQSQVE